MRISTSMIYENGGSSISDLQSSLNKTQQQIASGRKILTPADDPIGSARALVITQADALNDQYATNRQYARDNLSVADGVMSNVSSTLQSSKSLIISAGNPTLTDSDRAAIATQLQGNYNQLLGLANSTDGTGSYLFSGFSTTTAPYTQTASGATYNGDQGQRFLQADTSRQIPLSAPGSQIFGNIATSSGQFNILPDPSNSGQAAATASVNPATSGSLTGNNYNVVFDSTGANFSVVNKTTGAVAVPLTAYTNPTNVTFDGINLSLTNSPNPPGPNDTIQVQPANQNIFETLTDAINALKTPTSTLAGRKDLTAAMTQANNNIDKSLSNVLTTQAQGGTSLQELTSLDTVGNATGVTNKQTLSSIQDLDYAKAISSLSQQQTTLQAAQQSFVKISSLNLFNYLPNG